jgi:serine/threonine protein kinase
MIWNQGKTLQNGNYTILSELGTGGFAITYLAEDTTGKKVVIKTLNEEVQNHHNFKKFQDDFINEANRLAECNHPHIVKVYGLFPEQEQDKVLWCMVLEYIEGEDLNQLRLKGVLSEVLALQYIQQIADALIFVHGKGLLHRDVKPDNIVIRKDTSEAVLIDFGIAREFKPNQQKSYTRFFSDGYAPIEQYDLKLTSGYHTDLYGLAATLYTILTGIIPPAAPDRQVAIKTTGKDSLQNPQELNNNISDRCSEAIIKGMALLPRKRPKSVDHWLSILNDQPVQTTSKTTLIFSQFSNLIKENSSINNSNDLGAFFLGLIVILLGIGGGIYWQYFRPLPPNSLEYDIKKVYDIGEPVILQNTRICDDNGGEDITKVHFWLEGKDQNRVDLDEVTPFKSDDKCAKFTYQIKDKKLPLPGNYKLVVVGYDRSNQQIEVIKPFKINAKPQFIGFQIKPVYDIGENITINNIKVCDDNDVEDIDKVELTIKNETTRKFTINPDKNSITDKNCLTLNYPIKTKLRAGNYQVKAVVYDQSQAENESQQTSFKVNAPPRNLAFYFIDKNIYKIGDVFTITGAKICDSNGGSDIDKITFEWQLENGNYVQFAEMNKDKFTLDQDGKCVSSNYLINLSLSNAGNYEIRAIAYDIEGKSSPIESRKFTVIPNSSVPFGSP